MSILESDTRTPVHNYSWNLASSGLPYARASLASSSSWLRSDVRQNYAFSLFSIPDPACDDGIDNDGDEKIDYDGGLSALGYVAAEVDPQCIDQPWKDQEHKSQTCGLGTELLLLMPLWHCLARGPPPAEPLNETREHLLLQFRRRAALRILVNVVY